MRSATGSPQSSVPASTRGRSSPTPPRPRRPSRRSCGSTRRSTSSPRFALEDVEIFGHRFRRGDTVGCLLAAANRDPACFPDPARFDPGRRPGPHLAFGAGIHFCVGAPLARLELARALPVLFDRLPGLALAAAPVFADRYHFRALAALLLRHRSTG